MGAYGKIHIWDGRGLFYGSDHDLRARLKFYGPSKCDIARTLNLVIRMEHWEESPMHGSTSSISAAAAGNS